MKAPVRRPGPYVDFDQAADYYDSTRVVPSDILDSVAVLCGAGAKLDEGGAFLDAGIGTGRFGLPLARLYPGRVVGIDISRPMMSRIALKAGGDPLPWLVRGDLQRLPFLSNSFRGVLLVHVIHLIEQWPIIIEEARRVLAPGGALFLGQEDGGRSVLTNYYMERARAAGVVTQRLGSASKAEIFDCIKKGARGQVKIEAISAPYLTWMRREKVADTIALLDSRPFSTMWSVPDHAHSALMKEVREYAQRNFGGSDAEEASQRSVTLHTVRWR